MDLQDLIRRIPVSRAEVGAYNAFLPIDREAFYIVESGHVDLFAVAVDDLHHALTRNPFITRVPAGNAFFGSLIVPSFLGKGSHFVSFQAVPSRESVLLRGERKHLASQDDFDLDAVSLIRSSPRFSPSVQPNGLIRKSKCRSDGKRLFPCIGALSA